MLEAALHSLPHGPEFRFIDELVELDPGRSGRGRYLLRDDATFLKGHFPGHPLMPAVLMVESIAQLAGLVAQTDPSLPPLADLRLTAIRGIKIHGAALPCEILEIHAQIQGRLGPLIQAQGSITTGGRLLAEGQVTLSGTHSAPMPSELPASAP